VKKPTKFRPGRQHQSCRPWRKGRSPLREVFSLREQLREVLVSEIRGAVAATARQLVDRPRAGCPSPCEIWPPSVRASSAQVTDSPGLGTPIRLLAQPVAPIDSNTLPRRLSEKPCAQRRGPSSLSGATGRPFRRLEQRRDHVLRRGHALARDVERRAVHRADAQVGQAGDDGHAAVLREQLHWRIGIPSARPRG